MSTHSPQSSLASDESRWTGNGFGSSSTGSSLISSNSFAMDSLASVTSGQMDEPKRSYSACALSLPDSDFVMGFLERKPYRPFRSNEEYLVAMKEDLAEWLNTLYTELDLTADNFVIRLETGVILCRHANAVLHKAREWRIQNGYSPFKQLALSDFDLDRDVPFKSTALPGTFLARDNVANFIHWCRRIRIHECLLFETEDLVARKNEKSFVLCLLEVARYGAKFGLLAPTLVQFEQEIDQELEKEQQNAKHANELTNPTVTGSLSLDDGIFHDHDPQPQIINNDLESLHEKVVNLLSRCTCPIQFYLEHLSEGKYRIGDTKTLIFVRILRNHVMVRVGGGWDTLEHYLEKHDPCRCRFGHRYSSSARVSLSGAQLRQSAQTQMQVTYERPDQCATAVSSHRHLNQVHGHQYTDSIRRASTSSNDSSSSMCSSSLVTNPASNSEKCDSLVSSLSSDHSISNYPVPMQPDRNNNIKGLSNTSQSSKVQPLPQPKQSPAKKRILSTPDNSRIPKSKGNAVQLKTPLTAFPSASKAFSIAHKVKSTSTLAIPQFGSTTKIPCLDATNKPRPVSVNRYSSTNIYQAVSQESDKEKPNKRLFLTPTVSASRPRCRTGSNLSRTKQKSSLELNVNIENVCTVRTNSNRHLPSDLRITGVSDKSLDAVASQPQRPQYQQHRRHHSSSSLSRASKSTHNSPYTVRRELGQSTPANVVSGGSAVVRNNVASDNHRSTTTTTTTKLTLDTVRVAPKSDSAKRLQGSATSLNSTASTASTSTKSSSSNSLPTTVANSATEHALEHTLDHSLDHDHCVTPRQQPNSKVGVDRAFTESKKALFASVDSKKTPTPSTALVEVCSWLERNHLASG